MLETINEFVSNNSILVLLGLVAVVVLVGFVMFRRSSRQQMQNNGLSTWEPVPTPSHDLEGLDNTNMVCDLANGVCMPSHSQNPVEVDPGQEQEQY
jgi:LPXTG-motif cell wall-anchored protein